MAKEIERKFLVTDNSFKTLAIAKKEIRQGYLCVKPESTVRIRIADERAFITVKSRNRGCVRDEWEYEIPVSDASQMLSCCDGRTIEKTRYMVPARENNLMWEVDEFHGRHEGLVVAEIELPSTDTPFTPAPFVGREVTGEPQYYNSVLSGISS